MYLLPHPSLRSWISNYTITFPRAGMISDHYAIIPHGSATLVLSCDGRSMGADLFGPLTKPACVGREANASDLLFIVEFQPAGYYAFCGMPQNELTDTVLPLEAVSPTLQKLITQRLEAASTVQAFIAEVDRLFMAHVEATVYQGEFFHANRMIVRSGGRVSVKELSQAVFYSERHLGRLFDKYLGVSAKSYARLVRINNALRILQQPHLSMMRICLQSGYYDMPHFIHDFKSICGITPQAYRNNMSDFYSAIAKF